MPPGSFFGAIGSATEGAGAAASVFGRFGAVRAATRTLGARAELTGIGAGLGAVELTAVAATSALGVVGAGAATNAAAADEGARSCAPLRVSPQMTAANSASKP